MCPDIVPKQMTHDEPRTIGIPTRYVEQLPELRENPFRRRICEVFTDDGIRDLTFEDFLDMLSVFSEQAPRNIKVYYAFKIYDFDGDDYIGVRDLEEATKLLTRNELNAEEIAQVAEKVIEEADVDGDGKLSYMEFEQVILRAPDFISTFHIRI
ncbi:calcium and integrin-binding family member 2 isoform X2 [Bemisia tabaci]|nr:PREDICTED: calcium and integrin-binding family member 3 isoform X2 [Bemisia tabaci]